jgi:RNA polymerase sigma-54 factor
MKIFQEQKLKILPKLTPQIITTQRLLQIPVIELSQEIEREIEENPALEISEEARKCPFCEIELEENVCPQCGYVYFSLKENFLEYLEKREDFFSEDEEEIKEAEDSEEIFPEISLPPTLREYLFENFSLISLDENEKKIGEILIENINEYGYLTCEISEIARELKTEINKVENVLKKIQTIEPIGIGARNLRECLLLQIENLKKEGRENEIAKKIVENYLQDLAKHRYKEISKKLNVTEEEIKKAEEFIQKNLTPYPGLSFKPPVIYDKKNIPRFLPDVIIEEREGKYIIEIVESEINLKISPYYLKLYKNLKNKKDRESTEELEHIKRYILRAKLFMKSISQRRETLLKITEEILKYQKEFFITRERKDLKPLTQAKLAELSNLSESTVSRATNNKYIQLPWKEIVPFSLFFDTSLGIKKRIFSLIKEEKIPLKDQEIAEILKKEGINISRRTVAKYREELNILPYNLRKKQ